MNSQDELSKAIDRLIDGVVQRYKDVGHKVFAGDIFQDQRKRAMNELTHILDRRLIKYETTMTQDEWLDEVLFAYQQWVGDGFGPEIRLPGKRLTHDEARQTIISKIKSLEVAARRTELVYLLEDFGIEDNVRPIKDRLKELGGI
jgi:hypothetical protein